MQKGLNILILSTLLVACGNTEKQQSAIDTPMATDSITPAEEKPEAPDSQPEEEFVSLDHQTFNLHGIVVQVDEYFQDNFQQPCDRINFDEFGRMSGCLVELFEDSEQLKYIYPDTESLKGEPQNSDLEIDTKMERDEEGRLTKIVQKEFKYDTGKQVCQEVVYGLESYNEYTYTKFNDNHDPLEATFTGGEAEETWSGTIKYSYEYDNHHNWIKCRKNVRYNDARGESYEEVRTREIEYYR